MTKNFGPSVLQKVYNKVSVKEGKTLITMPHSNHLIRHLYSLTILDSAFTTDKKTVIHASVATTSNTIILIGLVLCESEDGENVIVLWNE